MSIIENVSILVGLDTEKLKSGMGEVMNIINGGMKTAAMGISAGMVVSKIQQNMHQFTAELSDLNRITKNVEMSVESLETWKNAAREFGADAEQFGRVFTGVNDAMFQMITKNRGILKRLIDQGLLPDIRDAEDKAKKTEQYVMEMANALAGMDKRTAANTLRQVAGVTDIDSVEFMQQGTKAIMEQVAAAKNLEHFTTKDVQVAKELEKAQSKLANAMKMTFLPVFRLLVVPMTKFADLCTMLARHALALYPAMLMLAGILGKTLLPVIIKVGTALKGMFLTPAGGLLLLLVAIGLLMEDIYVWAIGGESAFGEYYQAIADWAKKACSLIWDTFVSVVEFIGGISEKLKGIFNTVKGAVTDAFDAMGTAIRLIMEGVITVLLGLWNAYVDYFTAIFDGLAFVVESYCNAIKETWQAMTSLLSGDFDGAMEHIKAAFSAFFGIFQAGINWVFEKLGALAEKIPGLGSLIGSFAAGGGEASQAVPAAAGNTNNTTNTKVDGVVNVTIEGNATPEAIERAQDKTAWGFDGIADNINASQAMI